MELLNFIMELIEKYGYIIVIFAIMIESTGIPFPGETALLVAAAFAGTGHLNIFGVIVCATTGAIVGDSGGYWVGRRFGRPFLDKHGKWLHLTPDRMYKIENLFVRHGALTVFIGRFFSLLRTYAAIFAGVWRMNYGTFTLYNAMGAIVWASCFGVIGYLFGQNFPLLERVARTVGWALTLPVVVIVILIFIWRWAIRHQVELRKNLETVLQKSGINYCSKKFSWQIHWFLRHWTAAQYTIMHISFGLIVASAGIILFQHIALSAFSDRKIAQWDSQVFELCQHLATPLSTKVFLGISALGSYGISLSTIICACIFIFKRKWLNAIVTCTIVLGGQLLVLVLKVSFARSSIINDDTGIFSWLGFSFPSGHVMGALIVYGMITYFLIRWSKQWVFVTGIVLFTLFLVLLIGFSRIYLGENYLSDVLCGLLAGVVWLSSCLTALELLRRGQVGDRRRNRRLLVKTG